MKTKILSLTGVIILTCSANAQLNLNRKQIETEVNRTETKQTAEKSVDEKKSQWRELEYDGTNGLYFCSGKIQITERSIIYKN